MDVFAQEDAVENFLAGESKEFNDDLILSNVEEGIEFKEENDLENNVLGDCDLSNGDNVKEEKNIIDYKRFRRNSLVNALKKRSIRCLNKMHVMEDVREGSDVPGAQPSSPGHAEQRPGIQEIPQAANENTMENEEAPSQTNGETKADDETTAEDKQESKDEVNSIPEDTSNDSTNDDSAKRKFDEDESTNKRLRSTIEQNYILREKIFNEYVDNAGCTTIAQIQLQMDQIVSEVRTLNDLAREKEKEWNNIIHLKKMKEELLLRVQRRKQILMLSNDKIDWNEADSPEPQFDLEKNIKNYAYSSPGGPKTYGESKKKSTNLPSTVIEINGHSGDLRQNKQRPVLDVQSIIADYRQRHPEAVPRRGRRIRSILNNQGDSSSMVRSGNGSVMSFSSMSLGSGSQVKQNLSASSVDANTELGLLLTAVDGGKTPGSKSLGHDASQLETASFKDVLMQFAKLSQTERQDLLQTAMKPPPYSEVTVHPVPAHTQTTSNSLLHGILTKTQSRSENNKSTFSPTLARLLTAPERAAISPHGNQSAPVSISDMLSSNKARNEITITPVGGQFDLPAKEKGDEEEAEDSADRLVIDESEAVDGRKCADNGSDAGDEVPQCQGCNQKPAQFVCAGCGNQWYCSRECQVVAWDEHSEVCSG